MDTAVIARGLLSAPLLPPFNIILLGVLGLLLWGRRPKLGRTLVAAAFALLALLSTSAGARLFILPLEKMAAPLQPGSEKRAQAIVVLGGGRILGGPDYDGKDAPTEAALRRLAYAAKLHRETKLPILVTGGAPDGMAGSEAAMMARVLKENFGIDTRWIEDKSFNTAENALFSARLLMPQDMRRILLVTDAMHMPRSAPAFAKAGFQVIAAPTGFSNRAPIGVFSFIPRSGNLNDSAYAMREWIGLAWYALRQSI